MSFGKSSPAVLEERGQDWKAILNVACCIWRLWAVVVCLQPVCHHANPPPAYTSKRAIDVSTPFQVDRYRSRDLALCNLFPLIGKYLHTKVVKFFTPPLLELDFALPDLLQYVDTILKYQANLDSL